MNLKKPFERNFRITQKFGEKFLYFGKEQSHRGLDFACPSGTPIIAAHKGRVSRVRRDTSVKGYGFEVRIAGVDLLTQYAHLSDICVEEGGEVQIGDQIGLSGNTGFCLGSTGNHLHFGVKVEDKWVDPLPLFGGVLTESTEGESVEDLEAPPVEKEGDEKGDKSESADSEKDAQRKKVFADAFLVKQTVEKCVAIFGELISEIDGEGDGEIFRKEFEQECKKHFQIE